VRVNRNRTRPLHQRREPAPFRQMAVEHEGENVSSALERLDREFCRGEDDLKRKIESDHPTSMARTEIVLLIVGAVSIIFVWLGISVWVLVRMIGPR